MQPPEPLGGVKVGEYDLILRGLSYEKAREIADAAYGGAMIWHNGKAYPFDSDNPVEILKRELKEEACKPQHP